MIFVSINLRINQVYSGEKYSINPDVFLKIVNNSQQGIPLNLDKY